MQYSGGTVAVTYGQSVVWKNGTASWAGIKTGALFGVQGDGVFYPVAQYRPGSGGTRDSLVLSGTYRGSTSAGAPYVVTNDFTAYMGFPMINRGDLETATIFDYAMGLIDSSWKSVPGDMFKSIYDTTNRGYVDHAVLADQVPWSGVTSKPTSFTPIAHAPTHLVGGTDPIALMTITAAGLCPPVDNSTIKITGGKLVGQPQTPLPHAATHKSGGTDAIGQATAAIEGLCPPIDGTTIQISGGKLIAANHAARHWGAGADAIPLCDTTHDGLCPPVDGSTVQVLGGKLVCTVQVGAHLTYYQPFTVPAVGSNVAVTFSDISDIVPGAGYLLTDGVNFMNGVPVAPLPSSGLVVNMTNVGGSGSLASGGALGSGRVYAGNTLGGSSAAGVGNLEIGTVFAFAALNPPTGCMLCDGRAIDRNLYADLFTVIGTTYGAGDGVSTFRIPDLRGRFILGQGQGGGLANRAMGQSPNAGTTTAWGAAWGEETHSLTIAELAAHAHGTSETAHNHTQAAHAHGTSETAHNHTQNGHTHGMDHYHSIGAGQFSHAHGISDGGHVHSGVASPSPIAYGTTSPGYQFYQAAAANTANAGTGIGIAGNTVPAGNTVYASQTNGAWVNTGAATAVNVAAATGLGVTSTTATNNTALTNLGVQSTGSGTGHNTMPPFVVICYMIKASTSGPQAYNPPTADSTQDGLLRKVSGLTTDFVDGTNHCQDLASAVRTVSTNVRSYNALTNPNFEIDARTVAVGTNISGGWAQDKWQLQKVGAGAGTWVQTAAPSGIVLPGTTFCLSGSFLRFTLATQQTTLAATDYHFITQFLEGIRLRELLGGATSATVVARSSVAAKVGLHVRDSANGYSITKLVNLPNANAWTPVALVNLPTFPAGSSFPIGQGVLGARLGICLAAGTTYTAAANDVWAASNLLAAVGQDNYLANPVGTTFDLGFTQWEPGTQTGGILDKNFGLNFEECARYYQKATAYTTKPLQGNWKAIGQLVNATANVRLNVQFPYHMAKAPTVRMVGNSTAQNNIYIDTVGLCALTGAVTADSSGLQACTLSATQSPGMAPALGEWDADTGW